MVKTGKRKAWRGGCQRSGLQRIEAARAMEENDRYGKVSYRYNKVAYR
jgi:hypothetical protein